MTRAPKPMKTDPAFWSGYLRLRDERALEIDDDFGDVVLTIDAERALVVQLSWGSVRLLLVHPRLGEPVELGWDDDESWQPFALRWPEVENISTRFANCSPEEGLLYLLPFTFAEPRRQAAARSKVGGALAAVVPDLATDETVDLIMEALTVNGDWRLVSGVGWVATEGPPDGPPGRHLYSLRTKENTAFPHEALKDVVSP